MSDHYQQIYQHDAERYERLVAREDQRGNLFATLMEIAPFDGAQVVEFGAGTARVTRQLSVLARSIIAFDKASAMLREGYRILDESGMENWLLVQADNHNAPIQSGIADLAIEGWSFAHVTRWYGDEWQIHLDQMLAEMARLLKPNGTIVMIETMGTGRREPQPPHDGLAKMYRYLEEQRGFNYRWIRTDYQFESVAEADELVRFFFGDAMADEQVAGKNIIVPECTGIWWKQV